VGGAAAVSGFITKTRDYQPKLVARDDGFFDVVVDDLVRQGRVSREMGERIVRAIAGPPESREQQDKQLVERAIGTTALKGESRSRWYAKS
jgi:hypothetical protein